MAWRPAANVGATRCTLRVKTRREVRIVLAIVVAWYANISEMLGICAACRATGPLRDGPCGRDRAADIKPPKMVQWVAGDA